MVSLVAGLAAAIGSTRLRSWTAAVGLRPDGPTLRTWCLHDDLDPAGLRDHL